MQIYFSSTYLYYYQWGLDKREFTDKMLNQHCSVRLSMDYMSNMAFYLMPVAFWTSIFDNLTVSTRWVLSKHANLVTTQLEIVMLTDMEFFSVLSGIFLIPACLNISCLRKALTKDTVTLAFPLIEASFDLFFLLLQLYPINGPYNLRIGLPSCVQTTWLMTKLCLKEKSSGHDGTYIFGPIQRTFIAIPVTGGSYVRRGYFTRTMFMQFLYDISLLNILALMRDIHRAMNYPADYLVATARPYRQVFYSFLKVNNVTHTHTQHTHTHTHGRIFRYA